MSDDVKRPMYRYPEPLTEQDLAEMDQILDIDVEAFLRWLESGAEDPVPFEP